ncbi:MAG: hypothetical protein P4L87_24215 [Formivibrio sp.]|nr:hypothetical protein [Formivibrio sp.]
MTANPLSSFAVGSESLRTITSQVRGRLVQAHISANQGMVATDYTPSSISVPCPDPITGNFLNGTTKFRVTLRRGSVGKLGSLSLRFRMNIANAPVLLAPVPHWFNRIEVLSGSDGKVHATLHGDTLLANILMGTSETQWPIISKMINISSRNEYTQLGPKNVMQPGDYIFTLPILGSFIGSLDCWLGSKGEDVFFDIYPLGDPTISGTAANVTVTGIDMLINSVDAEAKDEEKHYKVAKASYFLNPIALETAKTKALVAGSDNLFDLNQVRGKAAFMVLMVRDSGAYNPGGGRLKLWNLGDSVGATIDIQESNGTSIIGGGTPIYTEHIRGMRWIENFKSAYGANKALYVIPLCHDIQTAFRGVSDGFLSLNGDSKRLVVHLPAAPTAEVQTVTLSGQPASGFYRFIFRGELSAPLAYNATTAQMAAAFNGLGVCLAKTITAAFSAAVSAGTSVVATFSHPETRGLEGDLIQIVENSMATSGAAAVSATTALTTAGTSGVPSGTYDVYAYFYCWKTATVKDGDLDTMDVPV